MWIISIAILICSSVVIGKICYGFSKKIFPKEDELWKEVELWSGLTIFFIGVLFVIISSFSSISSYCSYEEEIMKFLLPYTALSLIDILTCVDWLIRKKYPLDSSFFDISDKNAAKSKEKLEMPNLLSKNPNKINNSSISPVNIPSVLNTKQSNMSIHFTPKVFVEVKGLEDEERQLIKKGYDIENILLYGIRHKVIIHEDFDIEDYIIQLLTRSIYPFSWNKNIEVQIKSELILINYYLPNIEDLPLFYEITFKNSQPTVIEPNEKRLKEIWTDMCYKIVIRTLHEIFSSRHINDFYYYLDSISFNGFVQSLDQATGHITDKCIMSVFTKKKMFCSLDLTRVNAKQCFKRLKGVSAHDLASLTPIPPILKIDKNDSRFSESYDVISEISTGINLAAMDWRDFENLIRDLFEREFSSSNGEVKITRASKDGGVDAVVFDPDPIRGGKIIIQAKRYTNVVGLSSVRDLYGTVMNEGASKGILVTTSDYGSDSYNFAKDKPLTLLNGANLLHLMERHGHSARIDLAEAKKILNNTSNE